MSRSTSSSTTSHGYEALGNELKKKEQASVIKKYLKDDNVKALDTFLVQFVKKLRNEGILQGLPVQRPKVLSTCKELIANEEMFSSLTKKPSHSKKSKPLSASSDDSSAESSDESVSERNSEPCSDSDSDSDSESSASFSSGTSTSVSVSSRASSAKSSNSKHSVISVASRDERLTTSDLMKKIDIIHNDVASIKKHMAQLVSSTSSLQSTCVTPTKKLKTISPPSSSSSISTSRLYTQVNLIIIRRSDGEIQSLLIYDPRKIFKPFDWNIKYKSLHAESTAYSFTHTIYWNKLMSPSVRADIVGDLPENDAFFACLPNSLVVNSAAVGAYRLNDPPTFEEWKNMLASTGLKVVTVREHISQSFDADCEMIEDTYERPPKHASKSSKKRKRSESLTIPKKNEKHRAK